MNEIIESSTKTQLACSLSGPEAALGGVLRLCMKILEAKDGECRKNGYKRYWVVTNVDTVAAAIKTHQDKIKVGAGCNKYLSISPPAIRITPSGTYIPAS